MTSPERAEAYLAAHLVKRIGTPYAVFNPNNKPVDQLPVIYGFNNGGSAGFFSGCLLAEDGEPLGGHCCSHEGYMYGDLGILEGSRPDRHETFRNHYPDGYRMDFVGYADVPAHVGLNAAFKRHDERYPQKDSETAA